MANALILRDIPVTARLKLEAALSGRSVRIPKKAPVLLRRVPTLTPQEAQAVTAAAGDCTVYFRRRSAIQARHSRIRVLRSQGVPIPHIAAEVGLSETRIRQVLRDERN